MINVKFNVIEFLNNYLKTTLDNYDKLKSGDIKLTFTEKAKLKLISSQISSLEKIYLIINQLYNLKEYSYSLDEMQVKSFLDILEKQYAEYSKPDFKSKCDNLERNNISNNKKEFKKHIRTLKRLLKHE